MGYTDASLELNHVRTGSSEEGEHRCIIKEAVTANILMKWLHILFSFSLQSAAPVLAGPSQR